MVPPADGMRPRRPGRRPGSPAFIEPRDLPPPGHDLLMPGRTWVLHLDGLKLVRVQAEQRQDGRRDLGGLDRRPIVLPWDWPGTATRIGT